MKVYNYDGFSFSNTAHINDGGYANGIEISSQWIVFLSNGEEGLITYNYSGYPTSISNELLKLPVNFKLYQNYPNPFNPNTTIKYQLPKSSNVELSIYNILGQKVATLVNKKQSAGSYKVGWDATGFASGIYLYKLDTGQDYSKTKKLIVLK